MPETPAIHFYRCRGPYGFLSNFYPSRFVLGHPSLTGPRAWRTVEHYFQAMKATDDGEAESIRVASSPREAKRLGRAAVLRPDWHEVRLDIMETAVRAKFEQNPDLAAKLLATFPARLHEDTGEPPRDPFWGLPGDNLGKVLMKIREALRERESA